MTPREIQQALQAIRDGIGDQCYAAIDINAYGDPLTACIYPDGITNECRLRVRGSEFPEILQKLRDGWAEYKVRHAQQRMREMALAIIRITADQGACSDAALRADRFSQTDIDSYGAEACAKADEMAANGPFKIARLARANAA